VKEEREKEGESRGCRESRQKRGRCSDPPERTENEMRERIQRVRQYEKE